MAQPGSRCRRAGGFSVAQERIIERDGVRILRLAACVDYGVGDRRISETIGKRGVTEGAVVKWKSGRRKRYRTTSSRRFSTTPAERLRPELQRVLGLSEMSPAERSR